MSQFCLSGLCCRDMIPEGEAKRFDLNYDFACNPDDALCGCPDRSALALEQWRECSVDTDLDFVHAQVIPQLPPFIPNLQPRENARHYGYPALAAKATDIGGILSHDINRIRGWRQRYGVATTALLLIHQESRDRVQESLWRSMRSGTSFEDMQLLGNMIFVAPGFSVYDDGSMCPLRQILHMRLSLREAARANRAGIRVIPTFGWNHHRERDIEFLGAWCLRQYDKLQAIAVNAQTGSLAYELRNLAIGMMRIEELTRSEYLWIVFGGHRRIEQLAEFIPRSRIVHVARTEAFQASVRAQKEGLGFVDQLLISEYSFSA